MIQDEKLSQAHNFLRRRIPYRLRIGIILGSGLGVVRDAFHSEIAFPYKEIPYFPISTVPGHRGRLLIARRGRTRVLIMDGRVHRYEGYSFEQVTFPIKVMHRLGIRSLVITNAAGSLTEWLVPGDLMLIEDHVDLMFNVSPELSGSLVFHKSYYSKRLIDLAESIALSQKVRIRRGVLVASTGPTYETPAEVEVARKAGGHAVTMSTIPEVTMCHALGISVLGISLITNMAAWHGGGHREVIELARKGSSNLKRLITGVIDAM